MARGPRAPDSEVYLSLIIPTFNEESRIASSLEQILTYLQKQAYPWDVFVVDDGSEDTTREVVRKFSEKDSKISLISEPHRGKGHAVKVGMLAANGRYRFQCDADLSMPIEQIARFLPPIQEGYDIAVGSREAAGARRIGEPPYRHLMGRGFNQLVRLMGIGLKDTQCGFKCYAGPRAHNLFSLQRLDGFGFDVELLFLARQQKLKVVEVPVDWYYQSQSRVRPVRDTLKMVRDLISIRWYHLRGYYNM
ncbi:MAG: dolichyl-phosphate beta-glucosyltransferase [Dehalococcoidia bacterium]